MKASGITAAAVATGFVLASSVAADDWETGAGGNAARNSLSREVGPSAPIILWEGSRPGIVAQQAVIGEGLAIVNRIESFTIPTGTWIVAHDLRTGEERWAVQLPYDFPGESWRSRVTGVRDGRVYATRAGNTNMDYLYALSPDDGSILWRSIDLIDESTTESLAFADDGDPIVGNFNSLIRINAEDGTTVWETTRTCPTSNGCQAAVYGDRTYVFEAGAEGPVITAFDTETGARLYSTPGIGGGFIQQVGPLVGRDGTVYAPRTQNNELTDFLVAYEDDGTQFIERWRVPLGYVPFATFGVGPDGSVYSYSTDRDAGTMTIQRLDPVDGSVMDETPPLPMDFPAQPRLAVDAMGRVYFTNGGFGQGMVYCFEADLTEVWSEPIANVNVGGPAIGPEGILVVCGVGTDVRAYQTTDGLTVNAPEPGLAGERNLLAARGATPESRVYFVYGLRPGSAAVPGCPGLSVEIASPVIAGSATADDRGRARLVRAVPAQAAGRTILLQAVEPSSCSVSNRIEFTFPD